MGTSEGARRAQFAKGGIGRRPKGAVCEGGASEGVRRAQFAKGGIGTQKNNKFYVNPMIIPEKNFPCGALAKGKQKNYM